MDEPEELTVIEALEAINANEPHIIQYFRARGLLDILPDPSSKWASDRMLRKLQQRFKRAIFSLHPDTLGSGDAIELHRVKQAWAKLKEFYESPIDLTQDDDSETGSSDEDNGSEGETTTGTQSPNVGVLVSAYHDRSLSLSSERREFDRADYATDEDTNSVEGTNDPRYQWYMGKSVSKGFWFQGRVISLDVGMMANGNEGVLIQVEFDDGDKEDYYESEWQSQLVLDNDSTSICERYHPLGAIVWKKFDLEGEVSGCRIGEPVVVVVLFYYDGKK